MHWSVLVLLLDSIWACIVLLLPSILDCIGVVLVNVLGSVLKKRRVYAVQHEPKKSPFRGLRFFCFFEKSAIQRATDLAVSQLRGSAIAIISAYVPGQHMWASACPGPSSTSPKQCKSDGHVKIYNSVSARSPLTKSKKEKIIESAAI